MPLRLWRSVSKKAFKQRSTRQRSAAFTVVALPTEQHIKESCETMKRTIVLHKVTLGGQATRHFRRCGR